MAGEESGSLAAAIFNPDYTGTPGPRGPRSRFWSPELAAMYPSMAQAGSPVAGMYDPQGYERTPSPEGSRGAAKMGPGAWWDQVAALAQFAGNALPFRGGLRGAQGGQSQEDMWRILEQVLPSAKGQTRLRDIPREASPEMVRQFEQLSQHQQPIRHVEALEGSLAQGLQPTGPRLLANEPATTFGVHQPSMGVLPAISLKEQGWRPIPPSATHQIQQDIAGLRREGGGMPTESGYPAYRPTEPRPERAQSPGGSTSYAVPPAVRAWAERQVSEAPGGFGTTPVVDRAHFDRALQAMQAETTRLGRALTPQEIEQWLEHTRPSGPGALPPWAQEAAGMARRAQGGTQSSITPQEMRWLLGQQEAAAMRPPPRNE